MANDLWHQKLAISETLILYQQNIRNIGNISNLYTLSDTLKFDIHYKYGYLYTLKFDIHYKYGYWLFLKPWLTMV